ncbi:hypothetical protein HPP92_003070 [Vanilla planifolia]|uniref:Tubby C-terminal domain-containing protein n=1 Tax=Vanilla planifolia TaxID=51239 RepID=A0A835RUH8_VANPL|nr:hypothetical protein HPP92_003070 [Vanilla planifolia]
MDKENTDPFKGKKLPLHPMAPKSQPFVQLVEPVDSTRVSNPPSVPLSSSSDVWHFSDADAAPASSWSTLPNRSLLCRALPLDVGKCTCFIAKEILDGYSCYALYTNEGHGRQDRKLALARHRRRNGRSEFIIAENSKGLLSSSDEGFLATITSNLMGSKYQIWDQERKPDSLQSQSGHLLGVVRFASTITTLTGSFRSMRACIPKEKSTQLKVTNVVPYRFQHNSCFPKDWEERKKKTSEQLFTRKPNYNPVAKRYELDFGERDGRTGYKIQTSVKNFQLTLGDKGRQTILQFGRIGKSRFLMDYRYPLSGYQAFSICLASMDSKLCDRKVEIDDAEKDQQSQHRQEETVALEQGRTASELVTMPSG